MIGCDCATCRSDDPRDRRLRPSVLIATDDGTSAAGRRRARPARAGADPRHHAGVDAILFTHGHADHILGLDDVRRFNSLMKQPMRLYGDAGTLDEIRRTFGYVFDPSTPKGGGMPRAANCSTVAGPVLRRAGSRSCRCRSCTAQRPILGYRFGALRLSDRLQRAFPTSRGRCSRASTSLVLDALRAQAASDAFLARRGGRRDAAHRAARRPISRTCATICRTPRPARSLPPEMALAYDGLVVEARD